MCECVTFVWESVLCVKVVCEHVTMCESFVEKCVVCESCMWIYYDVMSSRILLFSGNGICAVGIFASVNTISDFEA